MTAIMQGISLYAKVEVPEAYREWDGNFYHVFVVETKTSAELPWKALITFVQDGKGEVLENVPHCCWDTILNMRASLNAATETSGE
jgi:hypothetical protein